MQFMAVSVLLMNLTLCSQVHPVPSLLASMFVLTQLRKKLLKEMADEDAASERLAEKIAEAINKCDGIYRLGLSTGSSPVPLYKSLVRLYKEGKVSFRNVEIFCIDEYYPAPADNQSRNRRLYSELLAHIDIKPENVHIPKLTEILDTEVVTAFCADFDAKAKGLDLLVMGTGQQGQVGFNEAGASDKSRTRTVLLPYASRKRESKNFANIAETPDKAIAMGISTMLSAKKIYLIGWGEDKAQIVKQFTEDPVLFHSFRDTKTFHHILTKMLRACLSETWLLGLLALANGLLNS